MTDLQPIQRNTSPVRIGTQLQGELVLDAATPGLERVRRVEIRVRGTFEYDDEGSTRREEIPGPESIKDRPLRGELRIPFDLSLPRDAPPSHQGKDVRISWEVTALLSAHGRAVRGSARFAHGVLGWRAGGGNPLLSRSREKAKGPESSRFPSGFRALHSARRMERPRATRGARHERRAPGRWWSSRRRRPGGLPGPAA